MQIMRLFISPVNMSYLLEILQITQIMSALKDLHHELGVYDLIYLICPMCTNVSPERSSLITLLRTSLFLILLLLLLLML